MEQQANCPKCGHKFASQIGQKSICPKCLFGFIMSETNAGTPQEAGKKANGELILPEGAVIGSYKIISLIGRGGMGTVYKAYQPVLDRFVAIKILPARLSTDEEFVKRFNREAKTLATLSHPNIIAIHDMGEYDTHYYFVMEYVEGVTVRDLIGEHKLPPEEALKIVPQLCDALEHAHLEGVVHRDIKPENILIDKKGRIKIADFGLARIVSGDIPTDTITKTQDVMGTYDYMAPEQRVSTKTVDHRADIYSLGVVFYEMLTGELPIGKFELPSHNIQIDVRVDDVVMKSLEKDPDKRYQRASEVGTAVTEIIAEISQKSQIKKPIIPMSRNLRTNLAGITTIILVIIEAFLVFRHDSIPDMQHVTSFLLAQITIENIIIGIMTIILGAFTIREIRKGYGNKWVSRLVIIAMVMAVMELSGIIAAMVAGLLMKEDASLKFVLFLLSVLGIGCGIPSFILVYILKALFVGKEMSITTKVMLQRPSRYSELAITSFGVSLLPIIDPQLIPFIIFQILGIILAIVAIRRIERSRKTLKGKLLAIAGLIISVGLLLLGLMQFTNGVGHFYCPNWLKASW